MKIITDGIDTEGRGWIPEKGDTVSDIDRVLYGGEFA